ncbi:ribosome biogenesis GTPase YlqF [Allobaculum sp. Allo2]|uniref:ribosome biogenesis GTPase YlqF n=1 Tax=Allobaculum sp. Allo2 TaxID=2853432 RepID=UPI001F61AFA8|nr:ribosome biogenesis GTPase YlqF [Allobaculum sp. Allo2]
MAKARRQMEENLKKVDFIIEIRDARMPFSSANPLLEELAGNKPRLVLLSKMDKADPVQTKAWIEALQSDHVSAMAVDLIKGGFRNKIISRSLELNKALIEKQKKRGIRPRALRAMVVGIPNVGKSTFINGLAGRKAAVTGDRPGVTKSLQWIKAGSDLEVLDTPGVLWPKFDDPHSGLILAALGSIKDDVVHMDDVALYCAGFLCEHNPEALLKTYSLDRIEETPWETLEAAARKKAGFREDPWMKTVPCAPSFRTSVPASLAALRGNCRLKRKARTRPLSRILPKKRQKTLPNQPVRQNRTVEVLVIYEASNGRRALGPVSIHSWHG